MQAKGYGQPHRNFWLGVYNGVLGNGGEAFFHSSLVLAPFLAALGASPIIIGMIPALRIGGWFLPQLFVASRLAHRPFKMPWYRRVSLVRIVAYLSMTASVFVFHDQPSLILVMVLAMIAAISVANGIGGVPFADITAKVVPHYKLGTYWALRNAIGGVLALLSGLALRRMLESDIAFPYNFGYLFLMGSLLIGFGFLLFCLIREPEGKVTLKEPFAAIIKKIPAVFRRDASFRRYMRVRFLGMLALLAEPFYAVYALQVLGAPASALGLYIMLATFASITANFIFRKPADGAKNVQVLQISIGFLLLAPLLALVMPSWQLFGLVFVFSAAGNSGMGLAAWNLLYAVSPEDQRPLYVGTANTFLSLPSLAPIAAGALIAFVGFAPMFLLAALLSLSALGFAFRFQELKDLDVQALETSTAPSR